MRLGDLPRRSTAALPREGGFTLVELLVVIAMLAILAGLVVGAYSVVITRAQVANTEARLGGLGRAVTDVLVMKGNLPARLTDLKLDQPRWLEGGVYVDAWGRPLGYRPSGRTFKLWSDGPDGVAGTADDLEFSN
jgi:prepilin-type N-terminal cleavage/methylation domain-containing protein